MFSRMGDMGRLLRVSEMAVDGPASAEKFGQAVAASLGIEK